KSVKKSRVIPGSFFYRPQVALENSQETFSSVDVAEELFKITVLLKGQTGYLADRYSERNEPPRVSWRVFYL
ncbi:hypothetical protein MMR81_25760, partial [Escherichia coli]|nr:hypothetical protein [Escherichia coli]